jgi:hypothetical protein
MKKLTLNAAELRVDSFDAGEAAPIAGTVQGHAKTLATCVTACATGPCFCASIESGC